MKIIIEGEAKEIAALVLAVQERQGTDIIEELSGEMVTRLQKAVDVIYGRPIKTSKKEATR